MKKQFAIKAAYSVKNLSQPVAKAESTNLLKFFGMKPSCPETMPEFNFSTVAKPVFSL